MAADFKRLVEDSREMTRRSFLAIAGWVGFTVASAIALFQSVKFIQPNATYEDPPAFKPVGALGFPSNYSVGSTTVLIDKRVVINRDPDGFYAISLICTHLGCTPRYFPDVTSDLVLAGTQISKDPDTGQRATKANPALPASSAPAMGAAIFGMPTTSSVRRRVQWTGSMSSWPRTAGFSSTARSSLITNSG